MADVQALVDGLVTRIQTISGLRATAYIPGQVTPPMAIIGLQDAREIAIGSNKLRWLFTVRTYVSPADPRMGQNALNDYLVIGTTSVRDAIMGDRTLGGVADTTLCKTPVANYGVYEHQGAKFWGFETPVEVIA